jgi:hypothetical protein
MIFARMGAAPVHPGIFGSPSIKPPFAMIFPFFTFFLMIFQRFSGLQWMGV